MPHLALAFLLGLFLGAVGHREYILATLCRTAPEDSLYLERGKVTPDVIENMRSWPHSGFSVDPSVRLAAGDSAGIERLMQYMVRAPFSLSRVLKITDQGMVVYKAEAKLGYKPHFTFERYLEELGWKRKGDES